MSGFGRIKRDRKKTDAAWAMIHRGKRRDHTSIVTIRTSRSGSAYHALACFRAGSPLARKRGTPRCGGADGRTPQSAIAKALKRLSVVAATRGRRK